MKFLLLLLVFVQFSLFSVASRADMSSALIKGYAVSLDLALADATREYVYRNSDHGEGEWSQVHGNDYSYVIDHLYRTAVGDKSAIRPELLCGHRAQAMQALLHNFGIRSRTIYLFSRYSGSLMGHVFLEIMNPETGAWEIQDPDYNVAYESSNGRRLSVAELISAPDYANVYPVNAQSRGWQETGARPLIVGQFFNLAYSPTEGMLYYNQQALDAGLVAAVDVYIRANYGQVDYIPAKIGNFLVRPLDFASDLTYAQSDAH
ncbi:hypothetical protein [Pseudomonas soli]|uniref:hypothetical protein n=1 Tax=Pseudomonas soli TaxID=1306993 RepID=UPI00345CD332